MLRGLALVAHRAMLRTARSPLRLLWALAYRALLRVVVGWVAWREPEASAYVRASFGFRDQIYGLSDLDVALVVSGDPNRVGDARDRLLGRWQRLCGLFPWLGDAFDLAVYEDTVLADAVAAPTLTYELARPAPAGSIPRSTYFGPQPLYDGSALRERPRVYGPLSDCVGTRDPTAFLPCRPTVLKSGELPRGSSCRPTGCMPSGLA